MQPPSRSLLGPRVAPLRRGRNTIVVAGAIAVIVIMGALTYYSVLFYVDPGIDDDSDGRGVNTITLSYTFYNKGPEALERHLREHHMVALPSAAAR